MTIGERIKFMREQLGLTQDELAVRVGYKHKTSINKIETGERKLMQDKILAFAHALETTPEAIMGWDEPKRPSNAFPVNDTFRIPLLGSVAAGAPTFDEGNVIGEVYVDPALAAGDAHLFALKVKGDSMAPKILDGDTLIVREQSDAENGDVVIVTINGEEGTCKKLQRYPDSVALISYNTAYEPIIYTWDEVEQLPVRVIGKVIQSRHTF